MKICIVIPTLNEARTIAGIVSGLRRLNRDVLVIDDGSKDKTVDLARQAGAHVIRHDTNQGKGISLQDGFAYALKNNYDGVVTMDGDGQHDVSDLESFLSMAEKHPVSIITGNRMNNARGMPFIRYITNRGMSVLISAVCRQRIPDTQCGYRYVSAEILKRIRLSCGDYEIESEILIKSAKKGFAIYSVPIKTIYSDEKSNIKPLRDSLRFIRYFLREVFSRQE